LILYLDTSALVGLYVAEDVSSRVRAVCGRAESVATSMLAWPEALAAFARKYREESLTEREYDRVLAAFREDWSTWIRLPVDRRLLPETARILRDHRLTGADAVHLATALLLQRRFHAAGEQVYLACNDRRLRSSAEREGLSAAW
jgi:predicted nucleic acid-binding protein